MEFPQKLQEFRRTAKISQEELAGQLGVSRQSVSKWEQGLSFPETEKLIELSTMMGVSIDSLLKGDAEPAQSVSAEETEPAERISFIKKNWLMLVLEVLLIVTSVALVIALRTNRGAENQTLQTPETSPSAETTPSEVLPTEPPATETVPEETEFVFRNENLEELQDWFFDFAWKYRLDYMPHFTREEGPSRDSGEYLYWVYAINLDSWGENAGKMSKDYVEETTLMYFAVLPEQHRSHRKSWDYDADAEIYTAYPEGLKEMETEYYLLNEIEIGQGYYTVHATRYHCLSYGLSDEEENRLKTALQEGTNTELLLTSKVTLTFCLDHIFHRPVFCAYTEELLTDLVS